MIRAIDKTSVHRICSGQVIFDLATAVKELVENSLDAGATYVEVRLKDQGLDGFEVLALKHYTSKISRFEDLTRVTTFGFRGEALSSLCATGTVTITTATAEDAPMAIKLEFDSFGKLANKTPCAREKGTTVSVRGLFESLPVRHREFKKNIKKEFRRCLDVLQSYALIAEGARVHVSNQSAKGVSEKVKHFATNGNSSLKDNFVNLFGIKSIQYIMEFDFEVEPEEGDEDDALPSAIKIRGLISK
ncbi:Mismatch repair endonuclease pms2 [Phlyctochytrium bullatum]|nr:Mismatch repair endonuclease pms2 [Phlyctochytrium bullatum]